MRRRIVEAIKSGVKPEKIVAVCGAFHAPVLTNELPPMSDAELKSLPRRESKLTLMPYSYFKLSSQSGYGAGNMAPKYFELLWQSLESGGITDLSRRYMTLVARHMREHGTHRSTAEVIEAVRLAETLSAFKEGQAPTLADLRDAAITLLGQGEISVSKIRSCGSMLARRSASCPKESAKLRSRKILNGSCNGSNWRSIAPPWRRS